MLLKWRRDPGGIKSKVFGVYVGMIDLKTVASVKNRWDIAGNCCLNLTSSYIQLFLLNTCSHNKLINI